MICQVTGKECSYLQQARDNQGEFRDDLLEVRTVSAAETFCEQYKSPMTMTDPSACGLAKAAVDRLVLKKEAFDA